jgi:hypothetical protein
MKRMAWSPGQAFALIVLTSWPILAQVQSPSQTSAQKNHIAAASSPEAAALLRKSLAAFSAGAFAGKVKLSGAVRRTVGSDDETGTIVATAAATDEVRVELIFPSGSRIESRVNSEKGPTGTWSGPDGVSHPIAEHNLLVGASWFFPYLMLQNVASSDQQILAEVGLETHNDVSVIHLSANRSFVNSQLPSHASALLQHGSQVEIYLDASTLLPSAVAFDIHPDHDARRDIPVEVRFSDYHSVSGMRVPFHVERYVNGVLILDLHFDTALINSGPANSSLSQ